MCIPAKQLPADSPLSYLQKVGHVVDKLPSLKAGARATAKAITASGTAAAASDAGPPGPAAALLVTSPAVTS